MTIKPHTIKVGTRGSALALIQTRLVIEKLANLFPELTFAENIVSTPGDRDQTTALANSPVDFFTRDLDDQVINHTIDCAIHSAKDLPEPMRNGVDWCWLPWHDDPRDTLVCKPGVALSDLPPTLRIGVSSERRIAYCRNRFPQARLLPIRGDIQRRLQQLDDDTFDMIMIAGAALNRLNLAHRVTEWLSATELPPPAGQGVLAITFRANDPHLTAIRSYFVKSVTFAGGGVGNADTATIATIRALQRAEVCLHDTLLDHKLLTNLPPHATVINVGKRSGAHHATQNEINSLLTNYARQGYRVVRLKGGDPGIFGRLAEEVTALDSFHLPYRVLPALSTLNIATTPNGMLLTRRGESRGFTVMTPRQQKGATAPVTATARAELPLVLFMAVESTATVTRELIDTDRLDPQTPVAAVFAAGSDHSTILRGTLENIGNKITALNTTDPGIIIIGSPAAHHFETWGPLAGNRVLITASAALQEQAAALVSDAGGLPICRPLITLTPNPRAIETLRRISTFDFVIITSPSAVHIFGELLLQAKIDLRSLPRLISCGSGTTAALHKLGLYPELTPSANYGTAAIINELLPLITSPAHVLRLASDKSDNSIATALRQCGHSVTECTLYHNTTLPHQPAPDFDVALFASSSAVAAFNTLWSTALLSGKLIVALGTPTTKTLADLNITNVITGTQATIEGSINALALHFIRKKLKNQ
ncbi:MAG: hydroxymethylbilane synthase [Lentisphaerae bacterium]|nr:hydroxymethylbilane synthase [Lentisphaerota bacterium]